MNPQWKRSFGTANMHTKLFLLIIFFAAVLNLNCATTSAPNHWLPEKEKADQQSFGGWITIEKVDKLTIRGELISVSDSGLYVMTFDKLVFTGNDSISTAKLGKYEETNPVAVWGLMGTLSTVSHGFYLVFSAPIWVVLSTTMASNYSENKIIEYPKNKLADFKNYARFPQGLGRQIDPSKIKPKSFPEIKNSIIKEDESIIQNNLNKPFQITISRSFILTESKDFDEYEIAGRGDLFGWFYLGGGINYNSYSYNLDFQDASSQMEIRRKNFSPFIEISKEMKLGTVNPFISGKHYFFKSNNNESSLNSLSAGANILIASSPIAVHIEFKKLFLTDADVITQINENLNITYKTQKSELNYVLFNLGVTWYF